MIYALAAFFLFYETLLQISPSVMAAPLMEAFQMNAQGLGLMASCYFYSYTFMQVPVGILFDQNGPRILLTVASFICSVGAFCFAGTNSLLMASFARFLMGFGSAFAFIAVLTIVARFFKPELFALLVGLTQFLSAVGAMIGMTTLSFLVNRFGFRKVLLILGIVGILFACICYRFVRNFKSKDQQDHHHANKLSVFEGIIEILRNSQNIFVAIFSFSIWSPMTIFAVLWAVPYLTLRYDISNMQASVMSGMIWIGVACSSPFVGFLSDKIKRRKIIMAGGALLGFTASSLLFYFSKVSVFFSMILLFLFGMASATQILSYAVVKDINRPTQIAAAVGVNNMTALVGGALLQPFVGYLLHQLWNGKLVGSIPKYSLSNYHLALSIIPLCFLLGSIISIFFIKETNCNPIYDPYMDHLI